MLFIIYNYFSSDYIIIQLLILQVVDMGAILTKGKPILTLKLVFVASLLSTQHKGERAKTGWLGIRIMCPSGATCLSAELFQ
jgi:hypothetical protein